MLALELSAVESEEEQEMSKPPEIKADRGDEVFGLEKKSVDQRRVNNTEDDFLLA